MAPAYFAGVRVHYPGALPGRCVRRSHGDRYASHVAGRGCVI